MLCSTDNEGPVIEKMSRNGGSGTEFALAQAASGAKYTIGSMVQNGNGMVQNGNAVMGMTTIKGDKPSTLRVGA